MENERLSMACETLRQYSEARRMQELRLLENEEWYRMRNYDGVGYAASGRKPKPGRDSVAGGYLFHAIESKHNDAMDNIPSAYIRAQEPDDELRARILSEVLPKTLERSGFRTAYSKNWYEKPKHGTGVYFVGWDPERGDGQGEAVVRAAELLRLYWQPGIEDLQDSDELFYLEFISRRQLENRYPDVDFDGLDLTPPIDPPKYIDEDVNGSLDGVSSNARDKRVGLVCVCDWYWKTRRDGRDVLHYVKFCGDAVIYESEEDESYYEDGRYPFVMDVMFPEKGTPAGFGLIAVGKQTQRYIDRLDGNLLEQALLNSRPQTLYSEDLGLDVEKLADKNNQFIPFTGRITNENLFELKTNSPDSNVIAIRQQKIAELKELTNNRDFGNGGTAGGVTAASAISLLQASGNKASRDFITESWSCFREVCELVLSRMRQFYEGKRVFRISGRRAERLARDMYKAGALPNEPGLNEPLAVEFDAGDIFYGAVGSARAELIAPPDSADTVWREGINRRDVIFDIELDSQNTTPMNELQDNQTLFNLLDRGLLNPGSEEMLLTVLDVLTIGSKQELIAYAERGIQRRAEAAAAVPLDPGGVPDAAAPTGVPDAAGLTGVPDAAGGVPDAAAYALPGELTSAAKQTARLGSEVF